ncbi:MAG: hypothetical protein ACREA9_09305 [Pyrinomonadaceae bacterium]
MDFLVTIDGNLSLTDTERRCEFEQNAGFQLDSIQFGTVVHSGQTFLVNKAAFDLKLSGRLNDLTFVEVGSNDPAKLKKDKEAEGWTFICDSQIYVVNHVTRIMVFGKKTS